ncbi:hypothetical protein DFH07DRAFT_787250 [Mycena maculata]|uniref:Uncharacterized protein n=1 Tax=Mycena maculata TaxID=230809 RepID=A0AAD7KKE6_9AGAR|nr:hypothetical protein DFH07DRAFT_787250 [Mycena maculata]
MDNPENDTVNPALAGNVGYDILLVKNTYVNQRIALMILTEYGLGLDAFKDHALQNKPFDVILVRSLSPRSSRG